MRVPSFCLGHTWKSKSSFLLVIRSPTRCDVLGKHEAGRVSLASIRQLHSSQPKRGCIFHAYVSLLRRAYWLAWHRKTEFVLVNNLSFFCYKEAMPKEDKGVGVGLWTHVWAWIVAIRIWLDFFYEVGCWLDLFPFHSTSFSFFVFTLLLHSNFSLFHLCLLLIFVMYCYIF